LSLPQNPMQLLKHYKDQLDPRFLKYYLAHFTNTRRHYIHWTACDYKTNFPDDYQEVIEDKLAEQEGWHVEVTKHNSLAETAQNADPGEDFYKHTYARNTNSWATCLACMDRPDDIPSPDQIKMLIFVSAMDHTKLLVPVGNMMGHGEAADNKDFPTANDPGAPCDPYGPRNGCVRWDLEGNINLQTLEFFPDPSGVADGGTGCERFMDYLRGQTILKIQEFTRSKWAA